MKRLLLVTILLSGCTTEIKQCALKEMAEFCGDKEGVYAIEIEHAHIPARAVFYCKNGEQLIFEDCK